MQLALFGESNFVICLQIFNLIIVHLIELDISYIKLPSTPNFSCYSVYEKVQGYSILTLKKNTLTSLIG